MINEKMLSLGSKRSIIREIFEYGKKRSLEVGSENVFDFSLGNPSVEPPKEVKETIENLLITSNATELHGYTSAQGDIKTRLAVSENIKNRFGVNITPDDIYMTCGAAASLTISLKALLNDGDECIVFAPYFTEYKVFIENAGGKLVKVNCDEKDFQPSLTDLSNKISKKTKAVIVNSPNNPSGVVYSEKTVKEICQLIENKCLEFGTDIYLISDEPYRELVYGNVEVPYIMNYYKNSIVCYSFSKSMSLPGERIGYIAVNPEAKNNRDVYYAICGAGRSLGYVCAPSLFQKVVEKCIGKTGDINAYKENRDLIYNALLSYGFECVKPDGAFYLFVKSPQGDENEFFERAKSNDVLVVPCKDFGIEGYVRIAYCVSKTKIERSLSKFKKIAESYGLID